MNFGFVHSPLCIYSIAPMQGPLALGVPVNTARSAEDFVGHRHIGACAIWLDVSRPGPIVSNQCFLAKGHRQEESSDILHLAILNHKSVPLAPGVSKDLGGIKIELQRLGKVPRWVGNEADLYIAGREVSKLGTKRDPTRGRVWMTYAF